MQDFQYFIYIMANSSNSTIYTGVTNDLESRILQHKLKINGGFTSKYNIEKLVYFEKYHHINDAIEREKQLKNWKRIWKNELIEKDNPEWKDLSEGWYADEDLVKE